MFAILLYSYVAVPALQALLIRNMCFWNLAVSDSVKSFLSAAKAGAEENICHAPSILCGMAYAPCRIDLFWMEKSAFFFYSIIQSSKAQYRITKTFTTFLPFPGRLSAIPPPHQRIVNILRKVQKMWKRELFSVLIFYTAPVKIETKFSNAAFRPVRILPINNARST